MSESKRGRSKEGVYEKGAAWCFTLLRMCCWLDGKETIRVVLNTALSRQMNTVVNRIRDEFGAIFKMTFSPSFSLLLAYVVVQRAGGSILMCLQKKYTSFFPVCVVQETGPCFYVIVGYFLFTLSNSSNTLWLPKFYCLTLELY